MKTYKEFITEITNAMQGGFSSSGVSSNPNQNLAGFDPILGLGGPRKRRKDTNETFAGCPVFTVSNDDYAKCMHGRMRYERWNKKLNMEDIENQDIRAYAHRNPGKPIIVKDDRYGTMSYFVPPKQEVDEATVRRNKSRKPYKTGDDSYVDTELSKILGTKKPKSGTKPNYPAGDHPGLDPDLKLDHLEWPLDEANYGNPKHMARHKKALQIIKFIDSVEKHKQKWTDSFGDFVKPALNKKLDVNGSGGVEYQQGRGRGDWNFIISSEDTVLYNNRNMPWMPKSGELPFDKFMKLLDTWKKETLRESVETGLTTKTLKSYMTKAHKQSIRGQQQSGKTIKRIQGFGKAQRKLSNKKK